MKTNLFFRTKTAGLLLVVIFLVSWSCSCGGDKNPVTVADLMAIDTDFSRTTKKERLSGWLSYFAADGMMFPADSDVVKGKQAIRDLMAPFFSEPGNSLSWKPINGEVSVSGDLGFTYGKAVFKTVNATGELETRTSKYLTVWKKDSDGVWKVVADIGN